MIEACHVCYWLPFCRWRSSRPAVLSLPTITDLKDKIADRNTAIADLEKEIAGYQEQLETTGKEAKTLQSTIKGIDLEQKKLSAQIRLTENRISAVNLRLQELSDAIDVKENRIGESTDALGQTIRNMNGAERQTLVETLLSGDALHGLGDG